MIGTKWLPKSKKFKCKIDKKWHLVNVHDDAEDYNLKRPIDKLKADSVQI